MRLKGALTGPCADSPTGASFLSNRRPIVSVPLKSPTSRPRATPWEAVEGRCPSAHIAQIAHGCFHDNAIPLEHRHRGFSAVGTGSSGGGTAAVVVLCGAQRERCANQRESGSESARPWPPMTYRTLPVCANCPDVRVNPSAPAPARCQSILHRDTQ